MARPLKTGLNYFSVDTDFFVDLKVRKIVRAQGSGSGAILLCLLCNIYRDNGYYMGDDEDVRFVVGDDVASTAEAVSEVISKALAVGFFDSEIYQKYRVLTSSGIQKRYLQACSERKSITIIEEYWLLDGKSEVEKRATFISCTKNLVSRPNNTVSRPNNTQRKVKESKEKNNKEREETPAPAIVPTGVFGNVMLTAEQLSDLEKKYPNIKNTIEALSEYMKSTGKSYADHYVTLMKWAREDEQREAKKNQRQQAPPNKGTKFNNFTPRSYGDDLGSLLQERGERKI